MDAAPAVEADDAVATGQQDEEGAGSRSSEKRHLSVPPATGTSLTIGEPGAVCPKAMPSSEIAANAMSARITSGLGSCFALNNAMLTIPMRAFIIYADRTSYRRRVRREHVTCFAPEENCAGRAISVVDAAQPEILVNTCALTTSSGIPVALIRAYARGVDVRMVAVAIRPVTFRQASARSLR